MLRQRLRNGLKRLLYPLLRAWYGHYGSREREYRYRGLRLAVLPGVFHPGLFFSTGIMMRFLEKQPIAGLKLLEIGSGSGAVACWAARMGAQVTASDIHSAAVDCTALNARNNGLDIEVVASDLFDQFPARRFDRVAINPPYYPRNPQNDAEKAFFCGENFAFFEKLYRQLPHFLEKDGCVWMILSEDCALETIEQMARYAGFTWENAWEGSVWGETNFIFLLKKT